MHDDWSCLFATAVTVMVVATPEGLPLSATLTCGIFYEMPDYTMVWEPSACYTMDWAIKKKKKSSLTKQALDS